jgi:ppGpp synthetase/RelA/SpoT-type nucleotidyltranferase
MNQPDFLVHFQLGDHSLEEAGISWTELELIRTNYLENLKHLRSAVLSIEDILRQVPQVHSIRWRLKDADHVLEKIIRKRREDLSRDINSHNYLAQITDLIGVRALHLFKSEWAAIHQIVQETWELHEQPIAYVRDGDSQAIRDTFSAAGCRIQNHRYGYRSVHYLLKTSPSKKTCIAELQVRTIFEEAWSEIDHRVRYPYFVHDPLLEEYSMLLNRTAGSADEMGTFVHSLRCAIEALQAAGELARRERDQMKTERDEARRKLEEHIERLEIAEADKRELKRNADLLSSEPELLEPATSSAESQSDSPKNEQMDEPIEENHLLPFVGGYHNHIIADAIAGVAKYSAIANALQGLPAVNLSSLNIYSSALVEAALAQQHNFDTLSRAADAVNTHAARLAAHIAVCPTVPHTVSPHLLAGVAMAKGKSSASQTAIQQQKEAHVPNQAEDELNDDDDHAQLN